MTSSVRRWWVVLLAATTLLAGCREQDPGEELAAAIAATGGDTFTFALTVQVDEAALDQLDGDVGETAAVLRDLVVDGERAGDGAVRTGLRVGGEVPVVEALTTSDGELFLRTGLPELLGVDGADVEGQLGPVLDEAGIGADGRAALLASFAGGWISLSDVGGLGELLADHAGVRSEQVEAPPAAADLDDVLAATRVTAARTTGEVRRLDVEVDAAALGGALGDSAAATLPGTVVVRDGRVVEARLDLAPAAGSGAGSGSGADSESGTGSGSAAGSVEVVLVLADHGAEVRLTRPDDAARLTGAELLEVLTRLEAAGAEAAAGGGDVGRSEPGTSR